MRERLKILITGANSLLSANLIELLGKTNYEIVGLVRNERKYIGPRPSNLTFVEGDITSDNDLDRAMQDCYGVIHIAALTAQNLLTYDAYRSTNVTGTIKVAEAAIRNGLQRFINVSSANVCGYGTKEHPGREGDPIKYPFSAILYALSKQEAEQKLAPFASQIEIQTVYPTFMIGPYDAKPSSGALILAYLRKPILLVSPGGKNFVCAKDVAQGLIQALEAKGITESLILGGENLSYTEFLEKMIRISGQKSIIIVAPTFLRILMGRCGDLIRSMGIKTDWSLPNVSAIYTPEYHSSDKAQQLIGYQISPIEEGISQAIKWFDERQLEKRKKQSPKQKNNMKKEKLIAASIIAAGLIVLGFTLKAGIDNFRSGNRMVAVKGLSEREVEADQVAWPIMYRSVGNNIIALNNELKQKNEIIKKFLIDNGITNEEITVSIPEIADLKSDRYSSGNNRFNYIGTSVVMVNSDKVAKIRELMQRQTEFLNKGIVVTTDYQYKPSFNFSKLNDIKPQMIEEATANARRSAEKFAADSQSEIGKIKYANQGQFSITDKSESAPHIKIVRVVTSVEYYLKD